MSWHSLSGMHTHPVHVRLVSGTGHPWDEAAAHWHCSPHLSPGCRAAQVSAGVEVCSLTPGFPQASQKDVARPLSDSGIPAAEQPSLRAPDPPGPQTLLPQLAERPHTVGACPQLVSSRLGQILARREGRYPALEAYPCP